MIAWRWVLASIPLQTWHQHVAALLPTFCTQHCAQPNWSVGTPGAMAQISGQPHGCTACITCAAAHQRKSSDLRAIFDASTFVALEFKLAAILLHIFTAGVVAFVLSHSPFHLSHQSLLLEASFRPRRWSKVTPASGSGPRQDGRPFEGRPRCN